MVTEKAVSSLDPSRTALLLLDFMNAALSFAGDATAKGLVERVARTGAAARGAGVQIVYVRVGLDDADYASISRFNKLFAPYAADRILGVNDPSTQITSGLAPQGGDMVVIKKRVGAFSTSNLDLLLSPRHFDNLVICGIATSGVVLSTVREAADRDYRLIVLSDCCADLDTELHEQLMTSCFPTQADVITGDEFAGLLGLPTPSSAG
jgi:nicotinamidase-related amidase